MDKLDGPRFLWKCLVDQQKDAAKDGWIILTHLRIIQVNGVTNKNGFYFYALRSMEINGQRFLRKSKEVTTSLKIKLTAWKEKRWCRMKEGNIYYNF